MSLVDENASGYTGFAKYKFFAFRTLYEVNNGWVERMKTWYRMEDRRITIFTMVEHGPFQHWYGLGRLKNLEITVTGFPTDHSQCGMRMGKNGWIKVIKTESVTDIQSFTMRMEGKANHRR